MPDWTYHPIVRPLLAPLRPRARRELLLSAIEGLARVPGGRALVRTFGDMRTPPQTAFELGGRRYATPIGLASGVDPLGTGRRALAEMGFGFFEIDVSLAPRRGGAIDVDERERAIRPATAFENPGLAATLERLRAAFPDGARRERPALVFRLVTDPAATAEVRSRERAELEAALAPWAAAFVDEADRAPQTGVAARVTADDAAPPSRFVEADLARARAAAAAAEAAGTGLRLEMPSVDERALATLRSVRAAAPGIPLLVVTQAGTPQAALDLLDAGATLAGFEYGYVFAGPLLAKRTNDALAARRACPDDDRPAYARPWFWTLALGVALCVGGALAWLVAATRVVLPYDEDFLGWSRAVLAMREPRLLHFMTHDRITLAGSMLSLGILYAGLALGDLRRGAPWAKRTVVVSAYVGLATYWLWLGFGYFDPLHALLTLIVLPFIVLATALRLGPERAPAVVDSGDGVARRRALVAQLLFVVVGGGFMIGGATIAWIGVTTVFVPTDVVYLHVGLTGLEAANAHLVPLVAHDRAGFGGDLFADGVAVVLTAMWGFRAGNRRLWWTIALAAIPGFGAALGVHVAIGYLDPVHLAPPVTALVLYACGLALSYPYLAGAGMRRAARAAEPALVRSERRARGRAGDRSV